MIVGIPIMQLILFGYAINSDPKHLPSAAVIADHSLYSRTLLQGLKNSDYFKIDHEVSGRAEAEELMADGEIQFVVTIPEDFGRMLVRGKRPTLLIEADASDPSATGNAIAALAGVARTALSRDLQGTLRPLVPTADPIDIRVHRRYNPEGITSHNIVPGLLGTILTMTMILMTGLQ